MESVCGSLSGTRDERFQAKTSTKLPSFGVLDLYSTVSVNHWTCYRLRYELQQFQLRKPALCGLRALRLLFANG